jgi:hypothetical protein
VSVGTERVLGSSSYRWVHNGSIQGILKGKYHCTIDLLFGWFGIRCMTTDNFGFYLQNRLIQPVKQVVNGTLILPSLVFPDQSLGIKCLTSCENIGYSWTFFSFARLWTPLVCPHCRLMGPYLCRLMTSHSDVQINEDS